MQDDTHVGFDEGRKENVGPERRRGRVVLGLGAIWPVRRLNTQNIDCVTFVKFNSELIKDLHCPSIRIEDVNTKFFLE